MASNAQFALLTCTHSVREGPPGWFTTLLTCTHSAREVYSFESFGCVRDMY